MKRSKFLYLSGMGAGALMLPNLTLFGNPIDPMEALNVVDVKIKKELADVALNAARAKGASYADIRIGRYLNQFVATREFQKSGSTRSVGTSKRIW